MARRDERPGFGELLVAGLIVSMLVTLCNTCEKDANAKKKVESAFAQGLNKGSSFCHNPKSKCYTSYRKGIQAMHEKYGPWCWEYNSTSYVACLSRIWLESRGNQWSHTKDTLLLEAGLTSVSLDTAQRLKKIGYGGDPCGDPKWAIAANAWRGMEQRRVMLEEPCGSPQLPCWSDWLPQQWKENRIEAEYFLSVCGGVNCWKVRKAVDYADSEEGILDRVGKDGKHHAWWYLLKYLRKQTPAKLAVIFDPLKVSQWKFGARWGRVIAQWKMRAEFFPPLADDQPNYCWGDEPYTFPMVPIVDDDGIVHGVWDYDLDMPKALFPIPKKGQWRKRCVLYGTKAWKKITGEPKRGDKWKTTGCVTENGITRCWKKGPKYHSDEQFKQAHAAWIDEQQEQRLLPSDEEYATWEQNMTDAGCAFSYPEEGL
jgi:hypothetical protein